MFGSVTKSSVTIDLSDLSTYSIHAAMFIIENPKLGLLLLNESLYIFI